MQHTWFAGTVKDSWKPKDGGFNSLFASQVRFVRERFNLQKDTKKPGTEHGDTWVLLEQLPHSQGEQFFMRVRRFSWLEFHKRGGVITPTFRLEFDLAQAIWDGRNYTVGSVLKSDAFEIVFPENFPQSPPEFRLQGVRGYGASHQHHLNSGDWLCIFAGWGDWRGERDNLLSGLMVAIDWMVWHWTSFEQ
jgi:hypothetical protein